MSKQEFIDLVRKNLEGQGSQIDLAGVLPKLLLGIIDQMESVGDLASLDTDHKSDVVSAINEVAGLVETPHFVISFAKSSSELKEIYDECQKNLVLAKNIVFYNDSTKLYYRVNGYNISDNVLKLHAIMGDVDTIINLASNGSLSVG